MGVIPGHLAMVQRSDDRPYAEGVHFLARIIQETLALYFFYLRLANQLKEDDLRGVEYTQAWYCYVACFQTMVINITKLIEEDRSTWNFRQIFREWSRYEHDVMKKKEVSSAIATLQEELSWIEDYRHRKAAHQTKDDQTTILTALPHELKSLRDILGMMDKFVDGNIPYTLHLHESGEEIDLRKELSL